MHRTIPALALLACASAAFGAPTLFRATTESAAARTVASDPATKRARPVEIDGDAFAKALATGELELAFFDDAAWTVQVRDVSEGNGGALLEAAIPGDPHGSLLLARRGDAFAGDLKLDDGSTWTIRPTANGGHVAAERMPGGDQPCGGAIAPPPKLFAAPRGPLPSPTDSAEVVDVFVGWTTQARVAVGGRDGILALVDLAIARTNQGYANSMVAQRVALVGAEELGSYVDNTKTPGTVLGEFATPDDGFLEGIHALRDYHRADCAALIAEELLGACGIAYQQAPVDAAFAESAFSVTDKDCVSNESFHHELGHNMGCHHDRANAGAVPFTYSYGWRWNGTSAGFPQFRSVMAYEPGARVNHFSNPDVLYDGTPTGVAIGQADEANNAATLDATAETVANFRISNDRFADAIAIDPSRRHFVTSTHGRGKEAGEPGHAGDAGGRSLWWSWTAAEDAPILASTQGSSIDTTLGVYTGATVDALTLVAENDDAAAPDTWSAVQFDGVAGTTYHIAVDGKGGAQGPIVVDVFAKPEIVVEPGAIAARTISLADPADAMIDISGAGLGTLEWSAATTESWLSLSPSAGTGSATVAASWNTAGLADGIYTTNISISSDNAGNSPQSVEATLEVLREPVDCTLVEVGGAMVSTGANRGRGNVISVTAPARLREIRASLSMAAGGSPVIRWNVLEGSAASGPFVGVYQKDTVAALTSTTALVSSGFVDVALDPAKFYAVVASWAATTITIPVDGGNPTPFPLGTVHAGVSGGFPYGSYVGVQVSPTTSANRYRMEFCLDTGDPEIAVEDHAGGDLANGAASAYFGQHLVGAAAPTFAYTVRNEGNRPLLLAPLSVPEGFEVADDVATEIAPQSSDAFVLRMKTDSPGEKGGVATIVNSDADEAPFAFSISGRVLDGTERLEGWSLR